MSGCNAAPAKDASRLSPAKQMQKDADDAEDLIPSAW